MRIVKMEDLRRLDMIHMRLERIPKNQINKILEDMIWLIEKLNEAYRLLEEEESDEQRT